MQLNGPNGNNRETSVQLPGKTAGTVNGRTEGGSGSDGLGASSTAAGAGGLTKPEAHPGIPRPRSMDEFQLLFTKVLRAADLSSCKGAGRVFQRGEAGRADDATRTIQLEMELSPSGEATNASGLEGPGGACILRVIRGLRFPPLPPNVVSSVKLSIRIALP